MTTAQKSAVFISAGIILLLIFLIIVSEHGYLDYRGLKDNEIRVNEQTEALKLETRKLEAEVQSLKTDLEYIKHVAKHEHDMVEEDELIFKEKQSRKKPEKGR